MDFNKKVIIYITTIVGALIIGSSILLLSISFNKPKTDVISNNQVSSYEQTNKQSSQSISSNIEREEYLYCVKLENGRIVVYKIGDASPFEILETDPSVLPEHDINELKNGIYLKTDSELMRLIEDFDG